MAARFDVDLQAVGKDFNCYIILWMQDKIYFIYYEYLIAHCAHYSYNEIKSLLHMALVIFQGSNNSASGKAKNETKIK